MNVITAMIKNIEKEISRIHDLSKKIRKNILDASFLAGHKSAHIGGALSSVEIISVLFHSILKLNKKNFRSENRDRFILSKGHACLVLYSALLEKGFISKEEFKTFEMPNSNLLGHPVRNIELGIEFSNGSLGMGLSLGVGLALAALKKKKNYKTFVLMGDGECNEGSVWEAAMCAKKYNLKNLTTIIDLNGYQQTGLTKDIMGIYDISKIWKSFGWETIEVDGHDIKKLLKIFRTVNKKPKAIIAKTTKGKGFSFSENNNDWHHNILTQKVYEQALLELKN
jgi:transketolase